MRLKVEMVETPTHKVREFFFYFLSPIVIVIFTWRRRNLRALLPHPQGWVEQQEGNEASPLVSFQSEKMRVILLRCLGIVDEQLNLADGDGSRAHDDNLLGAPVGAGRALGGAGRAPVGAD